MADHPLTAYRSANGLTQEAFGKLARTSAATVSRVEARTLEPKYELLTRLVEATKGEVTANAIIAAALEPPTTSAAA